MFKLDATSESLSFNCISEVGSDDDLDDNLSVTDVSLVQDTLYADG